MKTAELIGPALDWAVAKCGAKGSILPVWFMGENYQLRYHTLWSQGGPIIEREGGTIWSRGTPGWGCKARYDYANDKEGPTAYGPTPLIAAMRCYVVSKLGDEVEIPEELLK